MKYFLILITLVNFSLIAQNNNSLKKLNTPAGTYNQRNLKNVSSFFSNNANPEFHSNEDEKLWQEYLNRPHPSVITLNTFFTDASNEFNVPLELLMAIAQVESNWTQIGPSIDRGWGIMHLIENDYCNTLPEASKLLNIDIQTIKDNPKQNIRAGAALLSEYSKKYNHDYNRIEDWFDATKDFSGLINDYLREKQAENYFRIIKEGNTSSTLWGEKIILEPYSNIKLELKNKSREVLSPDYPDAIWNASTQSPNYNSRNNIDIDTWVIHYVGVGTYAGAISWFQHPDNNNSSAHFVIRSFDGEISQCVLVENRAWHCGASGTTNNSRSIGVEHEATVTNPDLWNSIPMLEKSALMACYFCEQFEIPKEHSAGPIGITGHNEMPGTNTLCPGDMPWDTWFGFLQACYTTIENNEINTDIKIYPNPFNDKITIEFTSNKNSYNILLIDALGRPIKKAYSNNSKIFEFGIKDKNLPKGTYFLILDDGIKKSYKTVIKQ